jgi:hypothetical protein
VDIESRLCSTIEEKTENGAAYFSLIGGAVFSAGAGGSAG